MSKEEKALILQMVVDGKITPEQGVELLRAVANVPQAPRAPRPPSPGYPPPPPASPGAGRYEAGRSLAEQIRREVEERIQGVRSDAGEIGAAAAEVGEKVGETAGRIGETVGREGERIGRALGESGANIGRMIAGMFTSGFGAGPGIEVEESHTGEFLEEGVLQVELWTSNGKIEVGSFDGPGFLLKATRKGPAVSEEQARELLKDACEFSHRGNTIKAKTRDGLFGPRGGSVAFELLLPKERAANLVLKSANGRIEIRDLHGQSLLVSTANGRIEAQRCDFETCEASSANGRIETDVRCSKLNASTANGRIEATLAGAGEWTFHTSNGRVEVSLKKEPDTGYEVDISSVAGKLEVQGFNGAQVLVDEARHRYGSRRYWAKTVGFDEAEKKAKLKATSAMGRVSVSL